MNKKILSTILLGFVAFSAINITSIHTASAEDKLIYRFEKKDKEKTNKNKAPVIETVGISSGVVNEFYSFTLVGTDPDKQDQKKRLRWSWEGDTPTGLILDENTGIISGTPTEEREFTFDITLRDRNKITHPKVKTDVETFTMNFKEKCKVGEIGSICGSDDSIYIGVINGYRTYAALKNSGILKWTTKDYYYNETGAKHSSDGWENTNRIATRATNEAAMACRNKGPEWYLPTTHEIVMLYGAQNKGIPFDAVKDLGMLKDYSYWTSQENARHRAVYYIPQSRTTYPGYKTGSSRVRCFKRDL